MSKMLKKGEKSFTGTWPRRLTPSSKELVHCIEKGLDPASDEVQRIIKKHHTSAEQIHHATQEVYNPLAQIYQEHPEFRKQLDPFHLELVTLMAEAMNVFTDRKHQTFT